MSKSCYPDVFTTGQVAKICKVAPRTVSKWFDSGQLKGYRLPSSHDRRFPREQVIRFMREHGLPLGDLESDPRFRVLLVGVPGREADRLRADLGETDYRYESAGSSFEAGIVVETFAPECVIVDLTLGRAEGVGIARRLQESEDHRDADRVALACEDEADLPGLLTVFAFALRRPFDLGDVAARVRERRRAAIEGRR